MKRIASLEVQLPVIKRPWRLEVEYESYGPDDISIYSINTEDSTEDIVDVIESLYYYPPRPHEMSPQAISYKPRPLIDLVYDKLYEQEKDR